MKKNDNEDGKNGENDNRGFICHELTRVIVSSSVIVTDGSVAAKRSDY